VSHRPTSDLEQWPSSHAALNKWTIQRH